MSRLLSAVFVMLLTAGNAQAMPEVTFIDQSGIAVDGVPVTFAQVFSEGEVPVGSGVVVKVGGAQLPTQVDVKATHRDGSLRHAVITTELPPLQGGDQLASELTKGDVTAVGVPVSAADLLDTSFDAVIELTLDGVVYTASARNALNVDSSHRWLSGPLVTEFLLKEKFTTENGVAHPHLTARFDIRAYRGLGTVRVDAIVENNWTYVPEPRNFTYDVRVLVGGREAYRQGQLTHYQRARWHKVFWWGTQPKIYVRHDVKYLQQTKAVPHYDPALTIPEDVLESQGKTVYEPMGLADMRNRLRMSAGGADFSIAPLPRWAARYIVSGDYRAYRSVLANGDAAGSYAAHLRDINTDLPVSLDDYPNVTGDSRQNPNDNVIALCSTDCAIPHSKDTAHQPSFAFLPYLLTGDHFYLDELLFWANGNMISASLGKRQYGDGLLKGEEVRGQAWGLRTLAQAAYITPDNHPMKDYFGDRLQRNLDYYLQQFPNNPDANKLGALPHHRELDTSAPWMDDFFTWATGYIVNLGFDEFLPMLQWKSKYPVERMSSPDDVYCWIFGGVYQLAIGKHVYGIVATPDDWYQSLGEVYLNTFGNKQDSQGTYVKDMACGGQEMANWLTETDPYGNKVYAAGEMAGHSSNPEGYPSNLQPALALAVDYGYPNADAAWNKLVGRMKYPRDFSDPSSRDYASDPQFAITPLSLDSALGGPKVNFSADSFEVPASGIANLSWSVASADGCVASGAWSGQKEFSGTYATSELQSDAVYTLKCSGSGGETTRSVLIRVSGSDNGSNSGGSSSTAGGGSSSGDSNSSGDNGNGDAASTVVDATTVAQKIGAGATTPWGLILLSMLLMYRSLVSRLLDRKGGRNFHLLLVGGLVLASSMAHAAPGLVMHWDFDGLTDATIIDRSGLGNDGKSKEIPVSDTGMLGTAMQFDSTRRDRVSVPLSGLSNSELSIAFWVRSNGEGDRSRVILSFMSDDMLTEQLRIFNLRDLGMTFLKKPVTDRDVSTGIALDDGGWHHVAVTWHKRNGVLVIYKDGVEAFRAEDIGRTQALDVSGKLSVGVYNGKYSTEWGNALNGALDDLRIYARTLSPDEVSWLASALPLNDGTAPQIPAGLHVVAVSPQESYLKWDIPVDDMFVAGYDIYRDDALIGTTGTSGFIDRSMPPGTTHTYQVTAFDGAGNESARSKAVMISAPAASSSVLDSLPAGHWYEVPESSIYSQLGGIKPNVMEPWSGAAYDTKRDRLVVWGGGHNNYYGNELYAFDINSLHWQQLTLDTPADQRQLNSDIYLDGLPSSRHTYNGLEYLPNIDRFFSAGGSVPGSGGCQGATWLYDFDEVPAESGWQKVADGPGGCGNLTAYDSVTGHVWLVKDGKLQRYDPLNPSDPWNTYLDNADFEYYMTGAIDPNRRKLVYIGGTNYGGPAMTVVYDIADPASVSGGWSPTTGANEIEDSKAAGFVFDPKTDRFVAWNGGDKVYALDPDSLVWYRMDAAKSNLVVPSRPSAMGTYGRFRYIPSKNLYVLVNAIDQNVFLYKLAEGSGSSTPYPSLDFTSSAASVDSGSSVSLRWSSSDAGKCVADGGWSGIKGPSGSETVGPLSADTRFVLTCEGSAGNAVRSLTVTVNAAPDGSAGNVAGGLNPTSGGVDNSSGSTGSGDVAADGDTGEDAALQPDHLENSGSVSGGSIDAWQLLTLVFMLAPSLTRKTRRF